jgi:hypothetical protein
MFACFGEGEKSIRAITAMTRKAFYIVIYLFCFFLFFEGGARLELSYLYQSGRLRGTDYDWRESWIKRHMKSGVDAFYKFDLYDPTKGWVSKPNLRDMQVFGDRVLNTNSRGLRGKREHNYEKPAGVTRILLLGDSFTCGDEVSDDETYAHYLQEMLPETEVINLGVHGYGHDQMLLMMEEEGVRYQPDIVILGFLPMDMDRNMLSFRDFAKPIYRLDDDLVLDNVPVPTPDEVLKWDWLEPRSLEIFALLHQMIRTKFGLIRREMEQKTVALLARVVDIASSIGARPLLVYLPVYQEINTNPGDVWGEAFLFRTCATIGSVDCFSARPHFTRKLEQGIKFRPHGHYDALGNRIVAEAIRDHLLENGYLPRSHASTRMPTR